VLESSSKISAWMLIPPLAVASDHRILTPATRRNTEDVVSCVPGQADDEGDPAESAAVTPARFAVRSIGLLVFYLDSIA
jgi:hypothetical protein